MVGPIAPASTAAEPQPRTALPCPSCAVLIDPPPVRNRLCPACREPIVVRHLEGRVALLTRPAVATFEAERRRRVDEAVWTAARQAWLRMARRINAPPASVARIARAPVSPAAVTRSRALYLAAAERTVRAARHDRRWGDVARVRRDQAKALYEEAGHPVPLPEPIDSLCREGMTATLRSLQAMAGEVELVGAGCCTPCREDDGKAFRTTAEIKLQRLPHAACTSGLCGCDWWPVMARPGQRSRGTSVRSAARARR